MVVEEVPGKRGMRDHSRGIRFGGKEVEPHGQNRWKREETIREIRHDEALLVHERGSS
jgi:hypothetical protein